MVDDLDRHPFFSDGMPPLPAGPHGPGRPPRAPEPPAHRRRRRSRRPMLMFTALGTGAVLAAGAALLGLPAQRSSSSLSSVGSATDGVTVPASADTYVVREQPGAALGGQPKLTAASWDGWYSESYVAFDVPATVGRAAKARLELRFERLTNQPSTIELRRAPVGGWSESTSWNSRPTLGPILASVDLSSQGVGTVTFDVSAWIDAPGRYAFALTNPSQRSAARFHARERDGLGPRLVVTPQRPKPTPTPTPTSSASATPTPKPTTPPKKPVPVPSAPVPVGDTLCGASFNAEGGESHQQALQRVDRLYGGLDFVRTFYPGLPAAWPGRYGNDGRPSVVSFKMPPGEVLSGRHDAYMRQWFAAVPKGRDLYWSYYHEPEDNIRDGAFSAADYRAAWRRLRGLADQADNPRLRATLVLMNWTLEPGAKRNWRDYYAGRDVIQVLGWDAYNLTGAKGRYQAPEEMYRKIIEISEKERLPFGIAETGSHLVGGDTGPGRAAWLRSMVKHLNSANALWVAYFDLNWSDGDYRLRDQPSINAWRDFC